MSEPILPGQDPLPGTEALTAPLSTEGTTCDGPRRPQHMPPDETGRCGYCLAVYPEGVSPRPAEARPGSEECPTCGRWKLLSIHSCPRVPLTDAAKQRYAERHGHVSWEAMQTDGRIALGPDGQHYYGDGCPEHRARPEGTMVRPEHRAHRVMHSMTRNVVRAAEAYADHGEASVDYHNDLMDAVEALRKGPLAKEPVHPRSLDQFMLASVVPGVTLAVDTAGCLVMHTAVESFTITNLEGFIGNLQELRVQRNLLEANDEH